MLRQQIRRAASLALCLVLCAACLMQGAAAAKVATKKLTGDQTRATCTFTIRFGHPNVEFELYRVASVNTDVRFNVLPEVAKNLENAKVNIDMETLLHSGNWKNVTDTLLPHTDCLVLVQSKSTDSRGNVTFSGVPAGLYLVKGDIFSVTDRDGKVHYYEPLSYMVCLPDWNTDAQDWDFDVTAEVQAKVDELPEGEVWLVVKKQWNDRNDADGLRPRSVTIELLQDGKVLEEITLDKNNNWKYTWRNLEAGHRYEVREKNVPSGYTVSYDRTGGTVIVENYHRPPRDPDPKPKPDPPDPDIPLDDPEVPRGDLPPVDPEDPENPDEEVEIDDPDVPLADLPQTGQLWWPVPLLAVAGMFLILVGWGRRRRAGSDEE